MPRAPKTATVSLEASPTSIALPGATLLVALVTNTSSSKLRLDVDFFVTKPGEDVLLLGYNRASLASNAQALISVSFWFPADAEEGIYEFEVRVAAGSTLLASDTAEVTASAS